MANNIEQQVRAAQNAANAGNWTLAEQHWEAVVRMDPAHVAALRNLGVHALQRGDADTALQRLSDARRVAPKDILVLMTLAAVHRQASDAAGEREALDAALEQDAYFVPALLSKADWLERHGTVAAAAATYANALKISPPESDWPADFRDRLLHAQQHVNRHSAKLHEHLQASLSATMSQLPAAQQQRWREAMAIRARRTQPYTSMSNQLGVPRLPAIPFFDRAEFAFLAELEAKTSVIRDELEAALASDLEQFQPYIAYSKGDPVNQWQELNHSERWSAYHLWRNGREVTENLERCPETAKAMRTMPLAGLDGLCPNVFFSALQPHTHIPAHFGESNARVIAHLPLIVPDNCRYRVGFEHREWRVGETLIFDDTIEHEAFNDSDELRVVLIFDLWNPLLSATERELASQLAKATREFGG